MSNARETLQKPTFDHINRDHPVRSMPAEEVNRLFEEDNPPYPDDPGICEQIIFEGSFFQREIAHGTVKRRDQEVRVEQPRRVKLIGGYDRKTGDTVIRPLADTPDLHPEDLPHVSLGMAEAEVDISGEARGGSLKSARKKQASKTDWSGAQPPKKVA